MKELGALYQYLRRNIDGLATKLYIGYNPEMIDNIDQAEWNKLRAKLTQIERFVQQKGGDLQDFYNAIQIGATQPSTGLGEAATAAAGTAAAAPFIAKIITWIKNIDWKKLLKKAPEAISKGTSIVKDIKSLKDDDKESTDSSSKNTSKGNYQNVPMIPKNTKVNFNKSSALSPNFKQEAGMSKGMIFGGIALLAAAGYYFYQQKPQPNRAK